jgi:hypothetical protein
VIHLVHLLACGRAPARAGLFLWVGLTDNDGAAEAFAAIEATLPEESHLRLALTARAAIWSRCRTA